MKFQDFIAHKVGDSKYCFSIEELELATGKARMHLKGDLSHAIEKKEISAFRRGFYLIGKHPIYGSLPRMPISFYIDDLFKYLKRDYYVSLFSASEYNGASHQSVFNDFVNVHIPSMKTIKVKQYDTFFHSVSVWPKKNIVRRKEDIYTFNMSSRALTTVDLIRYEREIGGINTILPNIEELSYNMTTKDVEDLLSWYPYKSILQRFGFLLEYLRLKQGEHLYKPIEEYLSQFKTFPVLLSEGVEGEEGTNVYEDEVQEMGEKWKVKVKFFLDSDLFYMGYRYYDVETEEGQKMLIEQGEDPEVWKKLLEPMPHEKGYFTDQNIT
ncbi:MAG: hypothetical protein OXC03_06595 [Flavobacteriaceae bacterium]|nr:hypothetical protein [Flavobacteriaceae bacterium]